MLFNTLNQAVELGWDFYLPVIIFVVLAALAVPVWASIGVAAITMLLMSGDLPLALVGESLFDGIDAFALTAVPLFILTGDVLVRTGLSRKFLNVAEAVTQFAKGGFGSATVLVCGMFAAISGSDAAGAAAVGRMTIDRLVESGYPRPYACALVAAGACTGILIPPSIAYIIIGLVLGISASTLFLAALIPGLLILTAILITNLVVNRIYGYEGGGNMSAAEYFGNLIRALASGWYAFIVPGIIFYGIFSGRLTPTEAGATAVIVTIIIGFVLGTLKLSDFPNMLVSSAKVNGIILPIIAFSLPLAQALAIMGVPQGFVHSVTTLTDDHGFVSSSVDKNGGVDGSLTIFFFELVNYHCRAVRQFVANQTEQLFSNALSGQKLFRTISQHVLIKEKLLLWQLLSHGLTQCIKILIIACAQRYNRREITQTGKFLQKWENLIFIF